MPDSHSETDEALSDDVKPVLWRVAHQSVRGPSHERSGLPNQDAVGSVVVVVGDQTATIMAVSDGHGSSKCFRSDIGSRLAVDAAISVLTDFIQHTGRTTDTLAGELCNVWDASVAEHLAGNPITQDELDILINKDGTPAGGLVQSDPAIAYGATVLGVAALGASLTFVQLGDGDILCVDRNGDTSRPVSKDETLIANETTSLCSDDASRYVQIATVDSAEKGIELVLVSTDGYSNSFRTEKDFNAIGTDYLTMIRQTGLAWVSEQLGRILENTTHSGSGDDISLGILKLALDTDIDEITQKISKLEIRAEFAGDGLDDLNLQLADHRLIVQEMYDKESKSREDEISTLVNTLKALDEHLEQVDESYTSVSKLTATYKSWLVILSIVVAMLIVYSVLSK